MMSGFAHRPPGFSSLHTNTPSRHSRLIDLGVEPICGAHPDRVLVNGWCAVVSSARLASRRRGQITVLNVRVAPICPQPLGGGKLPACHHTGYRGRKRHPGIPGVDPSFYPPLSPASDATSPATVASAVSAPCSRMDHQGDAG